MNRPDCGNQRTGQPRCAQLIAKTWNCLPSSAPHPARRCRAVSPSHGRVNGLRNVASRVSPSGSRSTLPSGIHASLRSCAAGVRATSEEADDRHARAAPRRQRVERDAELHEDAARTCRRCIGSSLDRAHHGALAPSVSARIRLPRKLRRVATRASATTSVTSWLVERSARDVARASPACRDRAGRRSPSCAAPWSLTSARNEPSTMELAFGPPVPSGPWHEAQNVW